MAVEAWTTSMAFIRDSGVATFTAFLPNLVSERHSFTPIGCRASAEGGFGWRHSVLSKPSYSPMPCPGRFLTRIQDLVLMSSKSAHTSTYQARPSGAMPSVAGDHLFSRVQKGMGVMTKPCWP